MEEGVLVSVIIPCFNHGRFLKEAIQSVQTSHRFEIVIVDDGSTDPETLEVLMEIGKTIPVIRQENKGVSIARNNAISMAKGKYIIPLDADNILNPSLFELGIAYLELHPEVGVVYGDKQVFGEKQFYSTNRPFDLSFFLYHHHIDTCSLFRKSVWEDAGGYDENMPYNTLEDWSFWIRVVERGWKFHYIPTCFFRYRYRQASKLRTMNSRSEVRLAMTKYFLELKEPVVEKALREGDILHHKARELKIQWRFALVYRALLAGEIREGRGVLIQIFKNESFPVVIWVSLKLLRQKYSTSSINPFSVKQ